MGKNNKKSILNNGKKCNYLFFCDKCNSPKEISKWIMINYLKKLDIDNFICSECGHKTSFPPYIKIILDDLINSI